MEQEHSSTVPFKTPNYDIETFPAQEWRIVVECDKKAEKKYNRHMRTIPDWKQIVSKEKTQVQMGKEAPLTYVEIIAIILYTGPMVSTLVSCLYLYT